MNLSPEQIKSLQGLKVQLEVAERAEQFSAPKNTQTTVAKPEPKPQVHTPLPVMGKPISLGGRVYRIIDIDGDQSEAYEGINNPFKVSVKHWIRVGIGLDRIDGNGRPLRSAMTQGFRGQP